MQPGTDISNFSDDKKLLAGCVKGNKKAWDTFVERYSGLIFHAISRTLEKYPFASKDQALDDLFQHVFLSLMESRCKKLRQFRWKCRLSTWLYTIAVRTTIDTIKKEGKAPGRGDVFSTIADEFPLPDEIVEMKEQNVVFDKIKQGLRPREQLFLKLFYDRELSVSEIASILRITENNVYQLKSRVTLKMKKILDTVS